MKQTVIMTAVVAAAFAIVSAPVTARAEHARMLTRPAPRAAATAPSRFYPDEIEGGVSGNLPFNNQIRKHTDPLNANGAK